MKKKASLLVVFLTLLGSVSAADGDGLVAHWKLNEGGGIVAFDSVGINHGVVYGPSWTTGVLGGALDFNGVDDYVEVSDDPSLDGMDALTLMAWAKTAGGAQAGLIGKYLHEDLDPSTDSYNLRIYGTGTVCFQYSLGSSYVIKRSAPTVTDDSWHHIVGVYTGSEGKIYIDGNEVPLSRDDPDPSGPINESDEPVLMGCVNYQGSLDQFFDGKIDDVRIYDGALSAEEVWDIYKGPLDVAAASIEDANDKKAEALEAIEAAMEKEQAALAALNDLLAGEELDDWSRRDVLEAKRKIRSAMRRQRVCKAGLRASMSRLQEALALLGYEVEPADWSNPPTEPEDLVIWSDINADGVVDFGDFSILTSHWLEYAVVDY